VLYEYGRIINEDEKGINNDEGREGNGAELRVTADFHVSDAEISDSTRDFIYEFSTEMGRH
jgi:hypothetical protein